MPVLLLVFVGLITFAIAGLVIQDPPRQFPKGHLHEYDPTGEYTYKHQNPRFN